MSQIKEGLTLEIEQALKAPVKAVFDAIATAEGVARWFGPSDDYTVEVLEWDLRPGGCYRIRLTHAEGTVHTAHGEFTEIEPERTLAYTWSWEEQPPLDTLVTFRLTGKGRGTVLRLTHAGFPDREARDRHDQGWSGSLDRLARSVAGSI